MLGVKADPDGIHTEVERQTRYLMAVTVSDLTSQTTAEAQLAIFSALPPLAARSTTFDNGSDRPRSPAQSPGDAHMVLQPVRVMAVWQQRGR